MAEKEKVAASELRGEPVISFDGLAEQIAGELDRLEEFQARGEWARDVRDAMTNTRAVLLGALAMEHVAERLDALIGLLFDDGRSVHVRRSE